jgi:murein DD-endopeptidase MepM/ murein hydrolase activator NlpD
MLEPLSTKTKGSSRAITFSPGRLGTLMCAIALLGVLMGAVMHRGHELWKGSVQYRGESDFLRSDMERNAQSIEAARRDAERHLMALSIRVAELQARVTRLDALGERLAAQQNLDPEEFNFGAAPAMGGPEAFIDPDTEDARPEFLHALDELASDMERREEQLALLDKLLLLRKRDEMPAFSGKPVRTGWMTSRFGRRVDPFSGRLTMHEGVDFAGKKGSDILSVGEGVVTWAGKRFGYGLMVEINHGNGYITRYGHASSISVKVGEMVKPGQVIALMGNSGRSTGTHLHFEIRRNGIALNPARVLFNKG